MTKAFNRTIIFLLSLSFIMVIFSACGKNNIKSLSVEADNTAKIKYYAGEYFSLQGFKVYANFSNGEKKIIDFANANDENLNGYTYDKYKKALSVYDNKVIFTYQGKTVSVSINVSKRITQAPNKYDISYYVTANTISILNLQNAEYKLEGGTWKDDNTFGGLIAGQEYIIKVRYKETDLTFASSEITLTITTNKGTQSAVAESDFIVTKNGTTITIEAIEGCEYKINNQEWTSNHIFENLTMGEQYNVQIRKKETQRLNPSAITTKTIIL